MPPCQVQIYNILGLRKFLNLGSVEWCDVWCRSENFLRKSRCTRAPWQDPPPREDAQCTSPHEHRDAAHTQHHSCVSRATCELRELLQPGCACSDFLVQLHLWLRRPTCLSVASLHTVYHAIDRFPLIYLIPSHGRIYGQCDALRLDVLRVSMRPATTRGSTRDLGCGLRLSCSSCPSIFFSFLSLPPYCALRAC